MKYDELHDWLYDYESYSPYQEKLQELLSWHSITNYNSDLSYKKNIQNGVDLPPPKEIVVLKDGDAYKVCKYGFDHEWIRSDMEWKYLG